MLLNVPPNTSGLISNEDIQVLEEFAELRTSIFSNNLAKHGIVTASSTLGDDNSPFGASRVLEESIYTYWAPEKDQAHWILYLDLKEIITFNVLQLQEPIQLGERIIVFHVDIMNHEGEWGRIWDGTTIGYKRFLQFPEVKSQYLRLVIKRSRGDPLISFIGVHMDPYITLTSLPEPDTTEMVPSNMAKFWSKLKDILFPIPYKEMSLRSQI